MEKRSAIVRITKKQDDMADKLSILLKKIEELIAETNSVPHEIVLLLNNFRMAEQAAFEEMEQIMAVMASTRPKSDPENLN